MSELHNKRTIKVEVCLSPLFFPHFDVSGKVVVVIDVFRASTTICQALQNGVEELLVIADRPTVKSYQDQGYLVGGEREGKKVEGFDLGNSPFEYSKERVSGKKVVLSTTNGTKCIEMASEADEVIIGSFSNLSAVVNFLKAKQQDVILFCAGWKDHYNLEDTLCAGAIASKLNWDFELDSTKSSFELFVQYEANLITILKQSAHWKRLSNFGMENDLEFASIIDTVSIVPILKNGRLIVD